jgi:hypothetical protein
VKLFSSVKLFLSVCKREKESKWKVSQKVFSKENSKEVLENKMKFDWISLFSVQTL